MSRKKILIVEDEDDVRMTIVEALERPYDVFSVRSGEEALAILMRGREFDLILSDVDMLTLKISGIELLRLVRFNDLVPAKTKFALMSGFVTEDIESACAEFKATLLQKPISPILQTVANILEEN